MAPAEQLDESILVLSSQPPTPRPEELRGRKGWKRDYEGCKKLWGKGGASKGTRG
jgi:hypothetical protein